ncbi:hypothetical protein JCM10450v2_007049 [Rhodotorula kratochvilovae]
MRIVRPSLCLLALARTALASPPAADDPLPAIDPVLDTSTATTTVDLPVPPTHAEPTTVSVHVEADPSSEFVEPEIALTTSVPSSPLSISTATAASAVNLSSAERLATTTAPEPSHLIEPSLPPDPPTLSSPPADSPEPSPSSPPIPVASPAPPVIEELPLTEVPPAPEFLSFNEWRERYVVHPDPSHARRAKKRARQDGAGAAGGGAGTERDGTDAPLPVQDEGVAAGPLAVIEPEGKVGIRLDGALPGVQTQIILEDGGGLPPPPTSASASSPIQPLADVGTGEPSDPLLHLKDRANYAGAECAAKLHRSSRQSKGASSILTEKKDRYMLTPCAASPKFVDVELCDEIQIDTLVLANFEFFSSTFKHFKASCSVDYPGKPEDWHDLGTFRARNVRGLQVFRPLSNPPFCRYIRVDFLSHFGSEYYCPVSLLRVYGYTQMEAFRESERKAKAIEEALAAAELIDDEVDEQEREMEDALKVEVEKIERVEPLKEVVNASASVVEEPSAKTTEAPVTVAPPSEAAPSPTSSAPSPPPPTSSPTSSSPSSSPPAAASSQPATADASASSAASSPDPTHTSSAASPPSTSLVVESTATPSVTNATSSVPAAVATAAESSASSSPPPEPTASPSSVATSSERVSFSSTSIDASAAPTPSSSVPPASSPSPSSTPSHTATGRPAAASETPIIATRPSPAPAPPARNDSHAQSPSASPSAVAAAPHVPRAPVALPLPVAVPLAQPQPGESIYGTIMKRLASLEHNQTLAMGYIEAQSGMLREAFGRVERRLGEVEGSRSRQEQSIRQSLLDLEKQRVDLERERLALAAQVSVLAAEVRFEKRLTIAQLVGLLLLVIFVGFTRGIPTSPFLHLAAAGAGTRTAAAGRDAKRKVVEQEGAEREREREELRRAEREREKAELAGGEASRRTHRNSPSASLSRHQSAKRYPSLSKPGALRRHYGGPATGPHAPSGSLSKAPSRAWTPPVRHSSAPPEDHLGLPVPAGDARRRSPLPRSPAGRTYEFPPRSPASGSPVRGAAHHLALPLPLPLPGAGTLLTPQALAALQAQAQTPSSADEAESEPLGARAAGGSAHAHAVRFGLTAPAGALLSPLESVSGFDGYMTYSSEDDAGPSAAKGKGKGRAAAQGPPSPASPATSASGSSPRPPRPNVPPRPATAMGIRFPSVEDVRRRAEEDADGEEEREVRRVQVPSGALPSPPPEPHVQVQELGAVEKDARAGA